MGVPLKMAKSVKLSSDLWQRVEQCAAKAGYSSAQELIEHATEKELARLEDAEAHEELERRLKGLGYLE
jgi:metal-responsive CopG/Arc/MetJ family transcriptional regulator